MLNIFQTITNKRQKRQACDKDTLKQVCLDIFAMTEQDYEISLYHLIHKNWIKEKCEGWKNNFYTH